ncbi:pentapeptide repeat-containing protein [Sorangium sp. So ce542]|uniref:pentapeptide repeat-containing protein n=1 Tax=Sorangium sp. So ce542 TaxID=3133316 RepID=UPI003F61EFFA
MEGASLARATLTGADATRARLEGANRSGANLSDARLATSVPAQGCWSSASMWLLSSDSGESMRRWTSCADGFSP